MDITQQISLFVGITVALCYGWYKKHLKNTADDDEIKMIYLKSLKQLKRNPDSKKFRDEVIEKGSSYYANQKGMNKKLLQSDFDAIEYDINEVIKNPDSLKDVKIQ